MARSPAKRDSSSRDDGEEEHERAVDIKRVKLEKAATSRARSKSIVPNGDLQEGEDSDYSDMSDSDNEDGVSHSELLDEDANFRAFEAARERQGKRVGTEAQAGIIKEVTLINFMNHEHFVQNLGPRMNFLVGHNGSGKSAVLTGIAVALGSKASTTGRGAGLKHLIRRQNNADKADVMVTLANEGEDAFRPDVYGSQIVIQRTITASGGSSYRFRATKGGKILETKREELTHICQHFGITIESPLTLLTQDQARSFLQQSDESGLYKFFLKGTTLQATAEAYNNIALHIQTITQMVDRQTESLPDLQKEADRYERQVRATAKVVELKAKRVEILNQLAWAFVTKAEKERDVLDARIQAIEEKIAAAKAKQEEVEVLVPPVDQEIVDVEAEVMRMRASRDPKLEEVQEIKAKITENARKIAVAQTDIANCKKEIGTTSEDIAALDKRIEQKKRALAGALDPEQEKARADLEKYNTELRRFQRESGVIESKIEGKVVDHDKAEREVNDAEDRHQHISQSLESLHLKKTNLEKQRGNRLRAYGENIETLLDDINNFKRWKHSKPIGPLGQWIHLKDPIYREVLQTHLGQTMCGFVVRCTEDRVQLLQMVQKALRSGYRPTGGGNAPAIIERKADMFDFSAGDLSHQGATILSKLHVDNPEALCILVNTHAVERTFVARDSMTADSEITNQFRHGQNQVTVFSADCFKSEGRLRQGEHPSEGNRTSGPFQPYRGTSLFPTDVATEIQSVNQEITQVKAELGRAQEARDEARGKLRTIRQEMDVEKNRLKRVNDQIPKLRRLMEAIQDKLEERTETDLVAFEQQKSDYLNVLERFEKEALLLTDQLAKLHEQRDEYAAKRDAIKAEFENYATKEAQLKDTLRELSLSRATKQGNVEHYRHNAEKGEAKKAQLEADLKEKEAEVEDVVSKAAAYCQERTTSNMDHTQLRVEQTVVEAAIETAKRSSNIDSDQAQVNWDLAKERITRAEKLIVDFGAIRKIMQQALKTRRARWVEIRKRTTIVAKCTFTMNVNKRGLKLKLDFDHASETLSIKEDNGADHADEEGVSAVNGRSVKTLSGGERSYSTICLLLSLWDTIACPVRFLDEWDVFLDAGNRKVAADMLINGARESDGKQFLLITPLEMENKKRDPKDKYIRMADPVRGGQRTLDHMVLA